MADSAAGENQPVLTMVGDIDIATEDEWRRRGTDFLAEHPEMRDVVVDMAQVGFLDSRGMAVLVDVHKQARTRGGTLTLRSVPHPVGRALKVAGLDQVFTIDVEQT
jgi:anti-sigma B factor antagonist